ncbi:glucan endo-1,3-beta-glucosidase-like [Chenopodium quinoa]|uniref:glucan endo-1,3-beta-glucosidase-like n=1 Tax=Chenopodium quinoa TaxID=63459 RepID=UPI000B78DCAB|nr:glucan endo-1,3-beta-glucosidase-like [Chenopodium quinoa]
MANLGNPSIAISTATTCLFMVATLLFSQHLTEAQIGVAYGRDGDNLPSPQDVVNLFKSNGIGAMRLYYPDHATLNALQGSGIRLTLGVPNDNIQLVGSNLSAAKQWVQANVVPFASSIKYILVGNEISPNDQKASSVLPAMQNVLNALNANNLGGQIKVSTSIGTDLVVNAYPPSSGQFGNTNYIIPIVDFIKSNGSPLMVNIYPYFAYVNNRQQISLDYALFTAPGTVVTDSKNGKNYQNLFDALADATYAALDRVGAPEVSLVTSESGWSSKGGFAASAANARTYYTNLMMHVKKGTPLKPGRPIETFLFSMFDEDKKPGDETERNFGLFSPNQQPKYGPLNFN